MQRQLLLGIGTLAVGVCPAVAAISLDLTPVDNTALLTGYHTYDLQVTTDTDWTAAAGLLELTTGSIYQHAQGADHLAPHAFQLAQSPTLAFDTYVIGSVAGGAGDVGGTGYAFNENRLEATWYNTTQDDIGAITIGRLTLTDDAAGSMFIYLTSEDDLAEYDVTLSPGVSPVLTEIIEEEGPDPWEWESPTIFAYPAAWPSAPSAYGYDFNPLNREPYVTPSLDNPRSSARIDQINRWDHTTVLRARPRGDLYADGHHFNNTFVSLEPDTLAPADPPSLLPEPGAVMLIGMGLGAAVLRRR